MTKSKYLKKNVYLCDNCGGGWVSADMDEGVTPFMDLCPICGEGFGGSLMYNVPQRILADIPARVEWRKPTQDEVLGASESMKHHYEQGGLHRVVVVAPHQGKRKRK